MHRWQSRGAGGSKAPPPSTKIWTGRAFTDVFDNTSDIGDFREHIFGPQTTQELPKKHHEAGLPEQLPTDALPQIDNWHTIHCEGCKEVCLRQRTMQRAFWKIYVGVCTWLSGRTAPPRFKTLRCLWHVSLKVIITLDNQGKMQPWWNICSQGSCLTLSPI